VTRWLNRLQSGDRAAAQGLWEGYFRRLVGLARQRLRDVPRRAADEEDVALSAFDSFWRGVEAGHFPKLADRDDLWQVLVMITARKACDLIQHAGRAKRDWRREQGMAGVPAGDSGLGEDFFPGLISREPDPAFAAQVAEECQRLLASLDEEELRTIAVRKMEGATNVELATQLGCAPATIERRVRLIRRRWSRRLRTDRPQDDRQTGPREG
jgi:DNA-directed RNA polymerase specialized sigma24 family protein